MLLFVGYGCIYWTAMVLLSFVRMVDHVDRNCAVAKRQASSKKLVCRLFDSAYKRNTGTYLSFLLRKEKIDDS